MKLAYFSHGPRGRACLQALEASTHEIVGLVGVEEADYLVEASEKAGAPLRRAPEPRDAAFTRQLEEWDADIFVCSGYNRILPPAVFDMPPEGTINLHGGRLPEYRGSAPLNWQLINGETVGGCAIIYLDAGIDTGPILEQQLYEISRDDTHRSLLRRTNDIFQSLLITVLDDIETGRAEPTEQDESRAGYYPSRYPRDSEIDWTRMSDEDVYNLVRAMDGPYPSAFTRLAGETIEIENAILCERSVYGPPGRVARRETRGR